MRPKRKLPLTEELDFAYLLELMLPLYKIPEFCWLPELFSIVGHDSLLTLCKYAGGETIRIPTVQELTLAVESLQWFYDVKIRKTHSRKLVPKHIEFLYSKIEEVYDASNSETEFAECGGASKLSEIFHSVCDGSSR